MRYCVPALVFLVCLIPVLANGAPITLSGIVTYDGPYDGDTLYVALLDTSLSDDGPFVTVAYDVGNSPVSQSFTFNLDNALIPPVVWVASLLDVDGGGVDSIGVADVVGWYDGNPIPVEVSTATSHSGLDFALPTAEIHGAVTFAPVQAGAEIVAMPYPRCGLRGLARPSVELSASGPYSIIGVYAGVYCVQAYGWGGPVQNRVCFGDFTCVDPTSITLGEGEAMHGVNLSFVNPAPVERSTWGTLKSRYP
jgi:hypothetical protein